MKQALGLLRLETHDELSPDGDMLRAEQVLSLAVREGVDDLVVVSHMPLIASLSQWLSEGVLGTGDAFALAEVRVLEAQVLAPGIATVVDGYVPPDTSTALQELKAMLSRFGDS